MGSHAPPPGGGQVLVIGYYTWDVPLNVGSHFRYCTDYNRVAFQAFVIGLQEWGHISGAGKLRFINRKIRDKKVVAVFIDAGLDAV